MNKKLLLLPLSALFVFMMAGMASATVCTFDQTATTGVTRSTYIDGTAFNISATLTAQADSEENGTVGILTNDITSTVYVFNTTMNAAGTKNTSQVNASVNTGEFRDDQSVIFTWTVKNESQQQLATCTRTYLTDNSVPGCSFASGLVSNVEYAPNQKWTVSCINASSATLQFGSNSPLAMAEASDSCTFTGDKAKVPEGSYSTLTARPSDGLNSTSCGLSFITIDIGIPLKQIAALTASGQVGKAASSSGSNNNMALIIIVGLAAYWYVRRKKK